MAAAQSSQSSQPSLAEIARKEAERRKTTKETKKVITTKDMPESARRGSTPPPPPAAGGDAAAAAGTATDNKPAAGAEPGAAPDDKGEAAWRGRITQAREALRRNELFAQALQTRINALTNDLANRGEDAMVRMKLTEDRRQAMDEMVKVRTDIETSKTQVADIEEEARKAGVPPGWVR